MAKYEEIRSNIGDGEFRRKIEVAAIIAAQIVMDGDDTAPPFDQAAGAHEKRLSLANAILGSPGPAAEKLHYYVMAVNNAAPISGILSADDDAIQANVNAAIDPITTSFEAGA